MLDSNNSPGATNTLTLIVSGSAPTLSSVQPASVNAGASDTLVTITGTGFNQNAQVTFNNSSIGVAGIAVNSGGTQITFTLSHTLLQFGGQFFIGVTNPPPGGGATSPQLVFTVNSAGAPVNDNFVNAIAVTAGTFTSSVDNSAATSEATDPIPFCVANQSQNPTGKSVWWRYTAGTVGTAIVNTLGSSYDTVLSAYTGAAGNFTPVACNHAANVATQSQIQFNTVSGTTYFFMVTVFDTTECPPAGTNSAECGGNTVVNFNLPIPGGLVASPTTMAITAGASATFTISTVSPPLSGQVTFSIAGCPPVSTCSFSPSTVVAGTSTSLSVTTTANGAVLPVRSLRRMPAFSRRPKISWRMSALMMILSLVGVIGVCRKRSNILFFPLLALLVVVIIFSNGCGVTESDPTAPPVGTTPGVYSIVITATGGGNVTATTTLNLTVN